MSVNKVTNVVHRLTSFLGHRATSTRNGHGVHSPFVYDLCENVFYNHHAYYAFERLDKLRAELTRNEKEIDTGNFGAGSFYSLQNKRRICDIASKGISSKKQSEVLYRLCNFLNVETAVELGTSLGLNTLYLAMYNPHAKVITIEGSKELSEFAQKLAGKTGVANVEFHVGNFDDRLTPVLKDLNGTLLFYIDGNHTCEATIRYFEAILPLMKGNSVIVFDDIYWSTGMTEAWKKICAHPDVKLTIDTYHSGYVFFKEEFREKGHFRLSI